MTIGARQTDQVILHVAVGANFVGMGVVLALLADLQDAYDLPTAGLGLIAGSSFVTSFFAYIGFARFADRGHAKTMLIAGTVMGAVALVMAAFARDLWSLVAARSILGLAEGAFVPAAKRVVLDWSPDRPGEVLGRVLAAAVGGFALGPVIGALLATRFGLQVPFLVPAAVLLAAIPVVARLRTPVPPIIHQARLISLLRRRLVLAGLALGVVDFVALGAFDALWARQLTDMGASTVFIGLSFTIIALPLIMLAPRFGRLVDRRSPTLVAFLGTLGVITAVSGYAILETPLLLASAAIVHGVGSAAIGPAAATMVSRGSPSEMTARGQAVLKAAGFLAAAVAAIPAGWAYETIGRGISWSVIGTVSAAFFLVGWQLSRGETTEKAPAG